jgi:HNH endonuclease
MTLIRHQIPTPGLTHGWNAAPDLVWTSDRLVRFLHPGYDDQFNILCTLPAADNGGVHFGTALTACGIIANNSFNGWFARERDAPPEQRDWDSVLLGNKFYYFVSNNPDGMIPDLARALTLTIPDRYYPVVPSFKEWQYPQTLPREWADLRISQLDGSSTDTSCRLSLKESGMDSAHIVPRHEGFWFNQNHMAEFMTESVSALDDTPNRIGLRADLHRDFDSKLWCAVLKEGRLVCQVFCLDKPPPSFVGCFHNLELQPISDRSKECFFARIAWTVLPSLREFFGLRSWEIRQKTAVIQGGKVVELTGKELKQFVGRGKSISSFSPSNMSGANRSLHDEDIPISISDWLDQVPIPTLVAADVLEGLNDVLIPPLAAADGRDATCDGRLNGGYWAKNAHATRNQPQVVVDSDPESPQLGPMYGSNLSYSQMKRHEKSAKPEPEPFPQ